VLEFRLLGPLRALQDGVPVALGGPRQRATLALLLLNSGRVVPVERIAEDLYAGAPPVTAVTQVQRQVSELRKALGTPSAIETTPPGYVIRLAPGQLDLECFERLAEDGSRALRHGDAESAAGLLQEALDLCRGEPLADLADEPFVRPAIDRLEEMRLAVVEQRFDAELALGRHARLVAELEALVEKHPFHEGFSRRLMLALYRSGRQAEALAAYQQVREALVEELGLEPTPALRELERAILAHDPSLERGSAWSTPTSARAVLVVCRSEAGFDQLTAVAEVLARQSGGELMLVRLVGRDDEVGPAAAALNLRRSRYANPTRSAAFTSADPAEDVVRLTQGYDVDLVVVAAPDRLESLPGELAAILSRSPVDVCVVGGARVFAGGTVYVPFGGGVHDWAALELACWLAQATGEQLRLVGTRADERLGRRDASRLLADAALAVQRVADVETEPVLADPSEDGLLAAVEEAGTVIVGISERWRAEGVGRSRRALLHGSRAPVLLVHRGLRPGGLAPHEARTRFTWTVAGSG
jgi:DNA-binding SARP family transcriptional activator